jgi:beta-galactosidase beta subunit
MGFGYEDGDPYAEFLPPPVEVTADGDSEFMRAVVIITEETEKGTARSHQEYVNPLLVLSGRDYASTSFVELHARICDALRGKRPRVVAQSWTDGGVQLILSDGQVLDSRKR